MSKRIVIVDDETKVPVVIGSILAEAGHTVLRVCVNEQSVAEMNDHLDHLDIVSTSLGEIVGKIQEFNPDFVMLDHSLGQAFDGQAVAEALELPPEKLIGTSSNFPQPYCPKFLRANKGARFDEQSSAQLLSLFGE